SFRYMIDRTLHRPREIILFCAQALEKARERAVTLPLPYAAVSWAERGYSAERAQDIAAEYRFQYPGLLAVFDAFRRRPEPLGRDEPERLCLELATGDIPTARTSAWLSDRDPASVIEIFAVCQSEITNCDVQLVVIGRHWLAAQGPHGRRL